MQNVRDESRTIVTPKEFELIDRVLGLYGRLAKVLPNERFNVELSSGYGPYDDTNPRGFCACTVEVLVSEHEAAPSITARLPFDSASDFTMHEERLVAALARIGVDIFDPTK